MPPNQTSEKKKRAWRVRDYNRSVARRLKRDYKQSVERPAEQRPDLEHDELAGWSLGDDGDDLTDHRPTGPSDSNPHDPRDPSGPSFWAHALGLSFLVLLCCDTSSFVGVDNLTPAVVFLWQRRRRPRRSVPTSRRHVCLPLTLTPSPCSSLSHTPPVPRSLSLSRAASVDVLVGACSESVWFSVVWCGLIVLFFVGCVCSAPSRSGDSWPWRSLGSWSCRRPGGRGVYMYVHTCMYACIHHVDGVHVYIHVCMHTYTQCPLPAAWPRGGVCRYTCTQILVYICHVLRMTYIY